MRTFPKVELEIVAECRFGCYERNMHGCSFSDLGRAASINTNLDIGS